jgi:hypothetical protein
MTLDPHVAATAVLTLCIGWFMLTAGLKKSALELRRRRGVCPGCGRRFEETIGCGCQ